MENNAYKVAIGQISTGDTTIMSPYAALEATWINFAILKGLKEKPWDMTVTEGSYPPYVDVWVSLDLLKAKYSEQDKSALLSLTEAGEIIVKLQGLFEYEHSMVQQQLDDNFVTDPAKYGGLRKALAIYTDIFLQETVNYMQSFVEHDSAVLDYGGGSGYYLKQAMEVATNGYGILLDKAPDMENPPHNIHVETHNFMGDNEAFNDNYEGDFDVVILSEVAHCLGEGDLKETLTNIHNCLDIGGKLIVIEQLENFRLNQRLFDMTNGGKCYQPLELTNNLLSCDFKFVTEPMFDNSHFTLVAVKD